jgi:hypothetical protein
MALSNGQGLSRRVACPKPWLESLWNLFDPYWAQDWTGRDGYFLIPDRLYGVLLEIVHRLTKETAEVDLTELVPILLQLQGKQSEQERAEALLKYFRICRRKEKPTPAKQEESVFIF